MTAEHVDINFRSTLRDDGRGTIWFGTSDGVFAWDGNTWQRALRGRSVFPKVVTRSGHVWAASVDSGLFVFDGGDWSNVPLPEGLAGAAVFDVAEGPDGAIWAATSRGVGRYMPAPARSASATR